MDISIERGTAMTAIRDLTQSILIQSNSKIGSMFNVDMGKK
jgi:hypothetical protein